MEEKTVKLEGFYSEDVLDGLLDEGKISHLEYIYHHSEELKNDFAKYCSEGDNPVEQNEESAGAFLAMHYEEREKSFEY